MRFAGVDAPLAAASHACDTTDFEIRQFGGPAFTVAPHARSKLSELGVPEGQWPQLTMLNRPVRQDGCKGATLALAFAAAGGQAR